MALWTPAELVNKVFSEHAGVSFDFDASHPAPAALAGYLAHPQPCSASPVLVRLSPPALHAVAPTLASIPSPPSAAHRSPVCFVVPAENLQSANSSSSSLALVPALAHILSAVSYFDVHGTLTPAVLFADPSSPAAGLLDAFDQASQLLAGCNDVIVVYDSLHAGREIRHPPSPAIPSLNFNVDLKSESIKIDNYRNHLSSAVQNVVQRPFSYFGNPAASDVVVVPASVYSHTLQAVVDFLQPNLPLGLVVVRSLRPWFPAEFQSILPPSVCTFHVYSESINSHFGSGALFPDILTQALPSKHKVFSLAHPRNPSSVNEWRTIIGNIFNVSPVVESPAISTSPAKLAVFWSADDSPSADLPRSITRSLSRAASDHVPLEKNVQSRLCNWYDNFAGSSVGLTSSALLLSSTSADRLDSYSLNSVVQSHPPSLLFLSDPHTYINSDYNPLELPTLSSETCIVFSASWFPEEVHSRLAGHPNIAQILSNRSFVFDADSIISSLNEKDLGQDVSRATLEEAAFWILYLGANPNDNEANTTVARLMQKTLVSVGTFEQSLSLVQKVRESIKPVPFTKSVEVVEPTPALPSFIEFNSTDRNQFKSFPEPVPSTNPSWHKAAQSLLFPGAYTSNLAERPDLPEDNFILTVTENRRLTPSDYDRNVFHMELSTKGTGLKYAVGEALGVHGWNDEHEVMDFIRYLNWGGPDTVVSFPSREDPSNKTETRTLFQTLQQNLDVFGKPPKTFYEALSKVASNREEARTLRFISSPEGSATLKKLTDIDTLTYADLLRRFPTAKEGLGLSGLLNEVAHIKPRHYSIASSQNFVGDSVHLLIVTVDWDTPEGEKRYGQCTRYLAGLSVGAKVMVSVKPSVMKLPPRDDQAVIMAGLGTGAAPFRAFIQERAWRKARGIDVGPLVYYFGSRYSSKEYLYGEEIEAYMRDGLITHAGLAFSRDKRASSKKEYIQHKMKNDGELLSRLLAREEAYFYLCGPTWPVPDVYEALVDSIMQHQVQAVVKKDSIDEESRRKDVQDYIESLKEEERYVLEVY